MRTLTDGSGAVLLERPPVMVEDTQSHQPRDEDSVGVFDEYFEALRRIDQRIVEAGGDASLKGFWLGLRREYEVEFDLLAQEVHRA
jgi:hypothetical protein